MAKTPSEVSVIEEGISTVLAPDIDFKGTLKFKTSLMIKGRLNGNIEAEGHLVIGPNARVEATIKAGKITNYGEIIGNVEAKELMQMKGGASQTGDLTAPDLIVDSGCSINGSVHMAKAAGKSS